jgi:peptide/nickel transport system substrate-binding protein
MANGMVTRREFVKLASFGAAALAAGACRAATPAPTATPTAVPTEAPPTPTTAPTAVAEASPTPAAPPAKYNEAPMLAELVKQGKLPPVEERLPQNPLVVEGLDGIGNYGGTIRKGFSGQADTYNVGQMVDRSLIRINHELNVVPCMAESWEMSEDATEYTFHLRKGLRWSDGAPLTANDFLWWYQHVLMNEKLTPAVPKWCTSMVEGKPVPMQVTAPDDYTVKFKFQSPNALFYLAGGIVLSLGTAVPAHYLKQFHVDFADKEELDKAVKAANLDDWSQLFSAKNSYHFNVERPIHGPWVPQNAWSDELVTYVRNPYFWEVDTAGNQLPYIDRLTFRVFQDPQVFVMWAANGEIDCQSRHFDFARDFTVLKENEEKGDYTVQLWRRTAVYGIHFNMTCKDQRLRKLFQERDFRIAASLCVDRETMIEMFYGAGRATPTQYVPPKDSPYHYPKLASAYLDYDPDRANALIDALGYTERDADGYRLWNDGSGERIRWTLLAITKATDMDLMLIDYFKELGFEINVKAVDRTLSIDMHRTNDVECTTSLMDRNLVPLADPQIWIKHTNINDRPWCNAWTAWKMDPKNPIAEEPPAGHWIWQIWELYDQLLAESDQEKQKELFWKILDIWAEELPSPGYFGDIPQIQVVKNGLKGIHPGYPWDCCSTGYEHIIDDATWYWEEPEKHA